MKAFKELLQSVSEFRGEYSKSPGDLVLKSQVVLVDYPQLLPGLAPILMPEQAASCGMVSHKPPPFIHKRARTHTSTHTSTRTHIHTRTCTNTNLVTNIHA